MSGFSDKTRNRVLTVFAILLAAIWIYAVAAPGPNAPSGHIAMARDIRDQVQKMIDTGRSGVDRFVERAHRIVTVKSLTIVKCEVVTADGGELAPDMGNFKAADVEIRAEWSDWFARKGESTVGFRLVPEGGKLRNTPFRIVGTTAFYTRSDCK